MITVGILGGGQLGMMLAQELHKLKVKVICLDPNPKCPASYICDEIIVSSYDNLIGLEELGKKSDIITYEFENIPAEKLVFLKKKFNIKQGIDPLFDSQNRIREKKNARKYGLNVPKFCPITSLKDLKQGIKKIGYPCIYKTSTLGYDGHGQVILHKESDIELVLPFLKNEGILEEMIDFDYETSIIMVRSKEKFIYFPMTINVHKRGILDLVIAENPKEIFSKIAKDARHFMEQANYYGILTIEFFVKGETYYFNEMAPRPHNSGHYTIEGCTTNQYRELARYLLDIPLEIPKLKYPTIMKNILGYDYVNALRLEEDTHIHIHWYHKDKVEQFRKMGHITFTCLSIAEYEQKYKLFFSEE